jgi:membrane protein DedA with SNARE-associated domain
MSAALPGPLGALAPVLDHYGYLAVAGLVMVESFGVPAPAQTLLIAAGLYAGTGQLNVVFVALLGFVAAVIGDSIGFWIGRVGGRRLVLHAGRYVGLTEKRVDWAEGIFRRHGGKIVVVARFIDGLRQFNGVIAGVVNMPWWRFLAFNALGAVLWSGIWTAFGYTAGEHIAPIYDEFRRYEIYLLIAIAVAMMLLLLRWFWRNHRPKTTADSGG